MTPKETHTEDASAEIDQRIRDMNDAGDWRGKTMAHLRKLIKQADPEVHEEIKWRKPSNPAGVPTYSHDGIIGTLETYKDKVKFTFAHGASLQDPKGVFNASLEGKTRRAIDIRQDDPIDDKAFQDLIRAAVRRNTS